MADDFAVAEVQVFGFAVFGHLDAELFEVVYHFLQGFADLALEVFEVDEYAEFSRLAIFKLTRKGLNSLSRKIKMTGCYSLTFSLFRDISQ